MTDSARLAIRVAVEETFGTNPSTSTKAITGATNAAPIVITCTAHGYPDGHVIVVAGVGGNTNANGVWEINRIDANSYSLVGSQGNAVYTSGGTAKAAVFQLRNTGESLKYNVEKKRSSEIRNDRQKSGLIPVSAGADGAINFELLFKEFDYLLAAALQNKWAPYGHRGVGATFTGTFSANNTLTASVAPVGASDFTTLKKGQWVKVGGASLTANNVVAQISKTTAPTTTVLVFEGTPFSSNGAAGAGCYIASSRLTNGILPKNFAIEKAYEGITQIVPYNGMPPVDLELQFAQGDIVTGSLSFMGKKAGVMIAATALDTPQAQTSYEPINTVTGVQQILRDGAAPVESFMALSLRITNNARARRAIANLGPTSIGYGGVEVSGGCEAYLTDGTRFDKYVNNTAFGFSWAALDALGNGYVITVPRARFADANPNATQMDQDVSDPGSFEAEFDSTQTEVSGLRKTIFIDRVGDAF
jgi:hypothetical protein